MLDHTRSSLKHFLAALGQHPSGSLSLSLFWKWLCRKHFFIFQNVACVCVVFFFSLFQYLTSTPPPFSLPVIHTQFHVVSPPPTILFKLLLSSFTYHPFFILRTTYIQGCWRQKKTQKKNITLSLFVSMLSHTRKGLSKTLQFRYRTSLVVVRVRRRSRILILGGRNLRRTIFSAAPSSARCRGVVCRCYRTAIPAAHRNGRRGGCLPSAPRGGGAGGMNIPRGGRSNHH
mmetsp:Transcript_29124/g.49624  ORF Transcript_29124/g.49624 Transcript_29124/m.49624 type:complete len:230 (-) Transcript_29124:379-1068(-)